MPTKWSQTTHNMTVSVRVEFLPEQSDPEQQRYSWAYHVTITNHRDEDIQLIKRHWKIVDANGNQAEVSGFGVVGEQPVITPNDSYEYSSGCPLSTNSGMMYGHYQMINQQGEMFTITIPAFPLEIPGATKYLN